jgi:Ion channel
MSHAGSGTMRALLGRRTIMFSKLLIAWALMAFCVAIHATGVTSVVRWLGTRHVTSRYWKLTWLFVRVAGWIILLHMIEITAWAIAYAWRNAMPDIQSALYFSAVTYTTTGYGDLVLPPPWRLAGAIEALTGILMCGWSTGFFFAVVSRMFRVD